MQFEQITVNEYSHLDDALLVESNGEQYAVGEDDGGYLTVLRGETWDNGDEEVFYTFEKTKQWYTQIPTEKFLRAAEQAKQL